MNANVSELNVSNIAGQTVVTNVHATQSKLRRTLNINEIKKKKNKNENFIFYIYLTKCKCFELFQYIHIYIYIYRQVYTDVDRIVCKRPKHKNPNNTENKNSVSKKRKKT